MKLSAHGFEVTLEPETGGLIRSIDWTAADGRCHALLHAPEGALGLPNSPRRFGLWAMVPFANRAFGAVIRHGDELFELPVNDPDTGSTIHGFGWQSVWEPSHIGNERIILRHQRVEGDDPYRYMAQLSISLVPGAVAIALSVVNQAAQPLPYGIGLHPWFNCATDTTLTMDADGAFSFAPGYRATGLNSYTDGGPYRSPVIFQRAVETAHSFTGWSGDAAIESAAQGFGIGIKASPNLNCPVVWAPADAPFLCVEPQSHGIGAPSEKLAGELTPLTVLQPGGALSGWMRLTPYIV
jgi:aldose 1-epimerase